MLKSHPNSILTSLIAPSANRFFDETKVLRGIGSSGDKGRPKMYIARGMMASSRDSLSFMTRNNVL